MNETSRITIENTDFVDEVFGETNSTVLIDDIVLDDAGIYYCIANNTGAIGRLFVTSSQKVLVTVLCKL